MDGKTLIKLLIVAAVLFFLWKKGLPYLQQQQNAKSAGTTSKGTSCVFEARRASEYFGSSLRAFSNPPYDMSAWNDFKSNVDERIARADDKCTCGDDSCVRAREAMAELRKMENDVDSMIRSGSPPPSDIVQRQERVDDALNAARDAADRGK